MNKRRIFALSVASLGVLFGLFYTWSTGPSVANIKVKSKDVKGATVTAPSNKVVDYGFMSIKIPDRYVSKTKTEGSGNPLHLQQLFTVPVKDLQSIFGNQLAVTIGVAPIAGIADLSDVRLRSRDIGYKLVQSDDQLVIYEKSSTIYEIGAFIKNGSNYTSLVFSGPQSNQTNLKKELNDCIASVLWH